MEALPRKRKRMDSRLLEDRRLESWKQIRDDDANVYVYILVIPDGLVYFISTCLRYVTTLGVYPVIALHPSIELWMC